MNPLAAFGKSETLGGRTTQNEYKSTPISQLQPQTPPPSQTKPTPLQLPQLGMPPSFQPSAPPQTNKPKEIKVKAFQHKELVELQRTYKPLKSIAELKSNNTPISDIINVGGPDVSPLIQRYKNDPKKLRVLFCGTYPIGQSNGYSRVVYYIAKYLGRHEDDLQFTVYGFQNYKQTAGSEIRNNIPSNVILHDALATEEPKRHGFGELEMAHFLRKNPQDIVIIFNDMVVTGSIVQTIMNQLTPAERSKFLLVSYMDQVYPYQKKVYMDMLNNYFDAIIAFTPYWRKTVRILGLRKEIPCFVFPHGFDHELYYPIPRKTARVFFNLPEDAFVVLNLNRNQPRKRWDHTMIAFAEFTAEYYKYTQANPTKTHRPIRLLVGTSLDGPWDIKEVYQHELHLRGVPHEFAEQFIVALSNPQQLSDKDINVLYNSCDVGINTCEGEGYGLCQIEHLAVGAPQVCPKIGGLQEFLSNENSTLIDAKWKYYIDKTRDGIGGIAEIGDPLEYGQALWKYYMNPKLCEKHAKQGRKDILTHYRWETVVEYFYHLLKHIAKDVKKRV
jgi:glycosyltransferase involved in cell wall biosynthesis